MTKATRWLCVSAAIGSMVVLGAGSNRAQDKAPIKPDAKLLSDSLKNVIDTGRGIFNDQGDHAGCYRLYQGALLSVRPLLATEMQKRIDEGIGKAEKMGSYADRAFELRRVLDEIRAAANVARETKNEVKDKKPAEKKEKKDTMKDTKDDAKEQKPDKQGDPARDNGQVGGTITYEGKPIAGGYSVTFVGRDKKKYTNAIQKDGTYQLATPIPIGEYRVLIEPIADAKAKVVLPPRYASEETSGFTVGVQANKNSIDLKLVK